MRHLKNPYYKKQDSYQKDHIIVTEYPKSFRKSWPRKKARGHRAERRNVHQRLSQVLYDDEDRLYEGDFILEIVHRPVIQKWCGSVVPLRQRVIERIERRAKLAHHRKNIEE